MKNEKQPTCKYCLDKEEEVKEESLPLPRTLSQAEIDETIEEMAELIRENKRLAEKVKEYQHKRFGKDTTEPTITNGDVLVTCADGICKKPHTHKKVDEQKVVKLAEEIRGDVLDNIIDYIYYIGAGISFTGDEPMTPQQVKEFFIREKDEIKEHFVEKAAVREIIPQEAELDEDERGYILNRPEQNQRNRERWHWVGGYNKALNDVRTALEKL